MMYSRSRRLDGISTPHLHHGRSSAILNQVVEERRIHTFTQSLSSFSVTFARDLELGMSSHCSAIVDYDPSVLLFYSPWCCYFAFTPGHEPGYEARGAKRAAVLCPI